MCQRFYNRLTFMHFKRSIYRHRGKVISCGCVTMFLIIILCGLFIRAVYRSDLDDAFERYEAVNGAHWNSLERAERFAIFSVNYLTNIPNMGRDYGVTWLAALTEIEISNLLSTLYSDLGQLHVQYAYFNSSLNASQPEHLQIYWPTGLPIDWSTSNNPLHHKMTTRVKNQYNCGNCWACASVAVAETAVAIHRQAIITPSLSIEQVVSCAKNAYPLNTNGCKGGWPIEAFKYILQHGISAASSTHMFWDWRDFVSQDIPSCDNSDGGITTRFDNWCMFMTDQPHIVEKWLAWYGPALVIVDATYWAFWKSDNIMRNTTRCESEVKYANHAVSLVGWGIDEVNGDQYWKVRNSWSSQWGIDGYAHILKDDQNMCGIMNLVIFMAPSSIAPYCYTKSSTK